MRRGGGRRIPLAPVHGFPRPSSRSMRLLARKRRGAAHQREQKLRCLAHVRVVIQRCAHQRLACLWQFLHLALDGCFPDGLITRCHLVDMSVGSQRHSGNAPNNGKDASARSSMLFFGLYMRMSKQSSEARHSRNLHFLREMACVGHQNAASFCAPQRNCPETCWPAKSGW